MGRGRCHCSSTRADQGADNSGNGLWFLTSASTVSDMTSNPFESFPEPRIGPVRENYWGLLIENYLIEFKDQGFPR